jgi:hypothetical protein
MIYILDDPIVFFGAAVTWTMVVTWYTWWCTQMTRRDLLERANHQSRANQSCGWGPQDPIRRMAADLVPRAGRGTDHTLIDGDWAISVRATSILGITRWVVVAHTPIWGTRLIGRFVRREKAHACVLRELQRHETVRLMSLPGAKAVAALTPNTSIMRRTP